MPNKDNLREDAHPLEEGWGERFDAFLTAHRGQLITEIPNEIADFISQTLAQERKKWEESLRIDSPLITGWLEEVKAEAREKVLEEVRERVEKLTEYEEDYDDGVTSPPMYRKAEVLSLLTDLSANKEKE